MAVTLPTESKNTDSSGMPSRSLTALLSARGENLSVSVPFKMKDGSRTPIPLSSSMISVFSVVNRAPSLDRAL